MSEPRVIEMRGRGARGESFTDILRRLGVEGTLPTSTDQKALENYAKVVVDENQGFKGDKGDPGGNVMAIGTFSAIAAMNIPIGTDRIRTSDGTDYIADATVDQAYVSKHPKAAAISNNGRGFRLALNQFLTVPMFGGPCNGVDDDAPSIRAALAYLKGRATPGGYAPGTQSLHFPAGQYAIQSTVDLKQCIHFTGDGGGFAGGMASRINVAAGCWAFIVHRYNTIGAGVEAVPTTGADGSRFDGLAFVGPGKNTPQSGYGAIWMRARAEIDNVYISGFSGNGVRGTGSQGSGGITEGNLNGFTLNRLRIEGCGDDAVFIQGADANAGSGSHIDASGCGGSAVNDRSFLGNNWYSCNAETCGYGSATRPPGSVEYAGTSWAVRMGMEESAKTTPPSAAASNVWVQHLNPGGFPAWYNGIQVRAAGPYMVSDINARTTLFGCYAEAGMGPTQGEGRSQAFGCFFEETGVTGGMNWLWNRLGVFNAETMQAYREGFQAQLLGDPNSSQLMMFTAPGSSQWRFKLSANDFYLDQDNFFRKIVLTGSDSAFSVGGLPFKNGVVIPHLAVGRVTDGDLSTYGRVLGFCTGVGELAGLEVRRGDLFFYSFPSAGGKIGLACTTAGVVGGASGKTTAVLKEWGVIDA